ncbi:MAG: FAD binding domain-containing protein [Candidatus Krumholzibacteriia bacterium]
MKELREYRCATSVAEAVALRRAGPGRGIYIAGGTDLFLVMPPGIDYVVDINRAGLDHIERTADDALFIGAAATLQAVAVSPLTHRYAGGAVAEAAVRCANRPVRSTATLGGNLCNALPSADLAPILLALDAVALIGDGAHEEAVPLADFFTGPRRTVLGDRLLLGVALPGRCGGHRARARKLNRTAEDISLVQVAVALDLDGPLIRGARVALGAVAPTPRRAPAAEEALTGLKVLSPGAGSAIAAAAQLAAARAEPIDDHRASAAYRRAMVAVLTRRLVRELTGLPSVEEGRA